MQTNNTQSMRTELIYRSTGFKNHAINPVHGTWRQRATYFRLLPCRWAVSITIQPLCPRRKYPGYILDRMKLKYRYASFKIYASGSEWILIMMFSKLVAFVLHVAHLYNEGSYPYKTFAITRQHKETRTGIHVRNGIWTHCAACLRPRMIKYFASRIHLPCIRTSNLFRFKINS